MNNTTAGCPIIICKNLCKSFQDGHKKRIILKNVCLSVASGEMLAIMGRSGTGKSTLLQSIAGLDSVDSGSIFVQGQEINRLTERKKSKLRNNFLGFIYQSPHLLPEFSVWENIALAAWLANRVRPAGIRKKVLKLLAYAELSDKAEAHPATLSGGERQRVAILRAVVTHPACVLADEPTGNLDLVSRQRVLALMQTLRKEEKTSFLVVTHDSDVAQSLDKTAYLQSGEISFYSTH